MSDAPWWDDARYGLFVHWGVMSLPAATPDARDTVIEVELDGGPDARPGSYVFWAGEARY